LKDKRSYKSETLRANSLSGKALKLDTIGMVAGGIVHDFNNLLTTISGYAEMISDELPIDSVLSEKVLRLRSAVTRASELTQQLTTVGDNYPAERTDVNVNEILREALDLLINMHTLKIRTQSDIQKDPIYVVADPNQLFRIFINLLMNAFQSMNRNGGLLSVSTVLRTAEKVKSATGRDTNAPFYALITIRDTGSGIDTKARKHIFEPQFSGKSDSPINGLGLSVVHDIVNDLEGFIRVTSKKGAGTTFRIYLPSYQKSPAEQEKVNKIL
jgi:signal transduction histidine kinase